MPPGRREYSTRSNADMPAGGLWLLAMLISGHDMLAGAPRCQLHAQADVLIAMLMAAAYFKSYARFNAAA